LDKALRDSAVLLTGPRQGPPGLAWWVGQRRRLLDYLHKKDAPRYQAITKKLKLRK
jgi:ribosomal protein S15P/S13E